MSRSRTRFIRNFQAGADLDTFLVSAVGSILVIRFYLHLTGYPQIGSGALHIAHVLWGGLLMLAAIAILLSFLSRPAARLAAVLGGIGFGTFLDEVGKFLTEDNDYFFQPSVAIIYGTCVAVYLGGRLLHGWRDFTPTEYLVNAVKELEELALLDLDERERDRARRYLRRADPEHPLTAPLRDLLADAPVVPQPPPGLWFRTRDWAHRTYLRVVDLPGFSIILTLFFAGQFLVKLTYLLALIFLRGIDLETLGGPDLLARLAGRTETLTFAERGEIFVGFGAGLFVLLGILRLRKSRLQAYRLFRTSILINIFLTEIFVFAQEEFGALTGFTFNLLVLLVLAYLIDREKLRQTEAS